MLMKCVALWVLQDFDTEKDRPLKRESSQDGCFYNRSVVRRFGDVGEVNAYLGTVMGKGNFCNVGDLTIGVQKPNYEMLINRSKNALSLSMTLSFFSLRLPPPNRETAGSILSISVPVVLT